MNQQIGWDEFGMRFMNLVTLIDNAWEHIAAQFLPNGQPSGGSSP